jgi:hypothetical protein
MYDLWKDGEILYGDLARIMFKTDGMQDLIPFLGAGVSVSDRKEKDAEPAPAYPDEATLAQVAQLLGLEGTALLYLEYAVRTAVRMLAWEKANGAPLSREEFEKKLGQNPYPPFAWELSELFYQVAAYHSFKDKPLRSITTNQLVSPHRIEAAKDRLVPMLRLFSMTTDLASPTDPLTSISGYYESRSERSNVWTHLYQAVASKDTPTEMHRLIADAARQHLQDVAEDYLIITTNYDWLMEKALDEKGVPYAVLWRNRNDKLIHSRFANLPAAEMERTAKLNGPKRPDLCTLQKNRSLAVVYKMHGCLYKNLTAEDDGLVVTDSDYVDFNSHLNDIIPSHVGALLGSKRLLFLGYSFSDWNVRSLYEAIIPRTVKTVQDYAVTRSLSDFEHTYFRKRNIIVIQADLASFAAGVRAAFAASVKKAG